MPLSFAGSRDTTPSLQKCWWADRGRLVPMGGGAVNARVVDTDLEVMSKAGAKAERWDPADWR